MKKASLLLAVMLLTICSVMGQYEKTQNIEEAFDNVQLDGNVRLYLKLVELLQWKVRYAKSK